MKMLKVKITIYAPQIKDTTQISQLQIDLKNSIKNLYFNSKKKDKMINEYLDLINKIREEYLKVVQGDQKLKVTIQSYDRYYKQQQFDNYRKNYQQKF